MSVVGIWDALGAPPHHCTIPETASDGAIVTCPSCGTRWQYTTTSARADGDTEEGEPCTAAAFDGFRCPGVVVNGQCTEQDDHHPTPGMEPA